MRQYVILENLPPTRSGITPVAPGMPTVAADTRVRVESLSDKDLSDVARDPHVAAFCPIMPTKLVAPRRGKSIGEPWGIQVIGADTSVSTGRGVTMALLDTGVDAAHPAFSGLHLELKNFTTDGDTDVVGHGTHCLGTICGRDSDGHRIGVANGITRVLSSKVLDDRGIGDTAQLFAGLQWAIDNRADVINLSLGFDYPGMVQQLVDDNWPIPLATSSALEGYRENFSMLNALMSMVRARSHSGTDAVIVAAAGNESQRDVDPDYRIGASLPAAAQDVLSVAAVGRTAKGLEVAVFSNSRAVLSAPGVEILSAVPGGGLGSLSGTSMAAPHVAGAAALWWEHVRNSGLRVGAELIRAKLLASAQTHQLAPGFDPLDVGAGVVRVP